MIEMLLILAAWYIAGCIVLAHTCKAPLVYKACHGFDLFMVYTCVILAWPVTVYKTLKEAKA